MMILEELRYSYGRNRVALPGRHEIREGESIHIIGANGSGKSTILKIIAGLISDYQGRVVMPQGWSCRYVPTDIRSKLLLPWHSIQKNVELLNARDESEEDAFLWLYRFLGVRVDQVRGQPAYTISAGESAAVALSCALASSAEVILLDETLAFMDTEIGHAMCDGIAEYVEGGGIAVIVGHHRLSLAGEVRTLRMARRAS